MEGKGFARGTVVHMSPKQMELNLTPYLSGSLSVNRVRAEVPQVSSKALIRVWDDVSVI
jgi:hypothetical protein